MKNTILKAGLTSTVLLASAVTASAALLDFTDSASYTDQGTASATGTLANGITWTLLPTPSTFNLSYVVDGAPGGATAPLAGQNDGVGVQAPGTVNDEITAPNEMLTLTFSERVMVSSLFFLDLFRENATETEVAIINVNGGSDRTFEATETFVEGGFGFAEFATKMVGRTFVFSAATTNDNVGDPDYALAGVNVEVAPVPLPAGLLLLGTGLAGLGIARRRRKQS